MTTTRAMIALAACAIAYFWRRRIFLALFMLLATDSMLARLLDGFVEDINRERRTR